MTPTCVHHTLGDVVWTHPMAVLFLTGWFVTCVTVTATAKAFATLVKTHTEKKP